MNLHQWAGVWGGEDVHRLYLYLCGIERLFQTSKQKTVVKMLTNVKTFLFLMQLSWCDEGYMVYSTRSIYKCIEYLCNHTIKPKTTLTLFRSHRRGASWLCNGRGYSRWLLVLELLIDRSEPKVSHCLFKMVRLLICLSYFPF